MQVTEMTDTSMADDLLNGAREITDFLGLSTRAVFHLLGKGALPAFKFEDSGIWHARKSRLRDHMRNLEERGRTQPLPPKRAA
jgi:hypothetical protein